MSLFGSVYDDEQPDGEQPDGPTPEDRVVEDVSNAVPAPPVEGPDVEASAPPVEGPDVEPSDVDGTDPEPVALEAPEDVSLTEFATTAFGEADFGAAFGEPAHPQPEPTDDGIDDVDPEPVTAAPTDDWQESLESDPPMDAPVQAPSSSSFSAFAEAAEVSRASNGDGDLDGDRAGEQRGGSVATLATPDPETDGTEAAGSDHGSVVPLSESTVLPLDDLLPGHRPERGLEMPELSRPRVLKLVALVVVVLLVGFFALRTLGGGSSSNSTNAGADNGPVKVPVPGVVTPKNAGQAAVAAQIAGAESNLHQAAVQAAEHFAEANSLALPATEWAKLLPQLHIQDGATTDASPGVTRVWSDDDAVCFQTMVQNGASVAVGVNAQQHIGFARDASGKDVCTTDAGVIGTWAPSLLATS